MNDLSHVLRDLVPLFERLEVPYAVMGGIAVRAYGIPRPTYDVDFTAALPRERLADFYTEAEELGYTVPEPYKTGWVDRVANMPVVKVRLHVEDRGIDVDVFLAESPFQQQVLERRRREQVGDRAMWMVSPEDLILLKLLARRPRDLADIGDVLFTQGQLDEDYLRQWAEQLGVLDELEKVLASSERA